MFVDERGHVLSAERLLAAQTFVQDAAQRAIEQSSVIRLSLADQECFAAALLSPPKPTAALKRAFARRKKLLGAE